MRTGRVSAVFVGIAMLAGVGAAQAQSPEFTSGALKLKLGGRVQLQTRTTSCTDAPSDPSSACSAEEATFDMFIRRARLTLDGTISNRLSFRIQPDFGELDGVTLKDAWGRYAFSPAARMKIGHLKRPFDGFQLTSSTKILTIERDLDIPGVSSLRAASYDEFSTKFELSDRDVGIELGGETQDERVEYRVGLFNGGSETVNGDSDGKPQLAGRVQVNLEAGGRPLALAGSAAITDAPFTASDGSIDGEYYTAFEAFAEYGDFKEGLHVQAGFLFGENPRQNDLGGSIDLAAGEEFANMYAWQAIASWKVRLEGSGIEAIEPLFRVTRAEPNTGVDEDENWGFTPGVQVFFYKRNKLALNWDIVAFADDALDSESSFKAQFQFHF